MGINTVARDSLIEDFMFYAERWAKEAESGPTGVNWGHAYGIYAALTRMRLVDQNTAAEMKAVLMDERK